MPFNSMQHESFYVDHSEPCLYIIMFDNRQCAAYELQRPSLTKLSQKTEEKRRETRKKRSLYALFSLPCIWFCSRSPGLRMCGTAVPTRTSPETQKRTPGKPE